MPRIPYIAAEDEPEELRPVFDQLRRTRGRVPGMYRLLAHQPAVLAAHRGYFDAALDTGVLPRAFKEKIAFKVARLRGSDYCTGSHRRYALDHGVGPQELEAIDRSDYGGLEPAEQAALRFAEAMVKSGGDAGEELFAALQIHFNEAEFVEIVALVGIMELASTFAAAFDLQPD